MKDYTTVNGVDKKRNELTAQIQDTHARLLKKNTALMAAFCYDPLQEAYRELRMQVRFPPAFLTDHTSMSMCFWDANPVVLFWLLRSITSNDYFSLNAVGLRDDLQQHI